ncbi:MAG: glycoside hydrolase family 16 protein [Scytolyngbya sp. HA4215-MV1]|nr:glycoside hydrolase family 16 protein [Scytolyngbya sp. HA4215-MV1]
MKMNRSVLFSFALLTGYGLLKPSVNFAQIAPKSPVTGYSNLVLNEEFTGASLDTTRWIAGFPWGTCQTGNAYTDYCPNNVKVANGMLELAVTGPGSNGKTKGGVISTRQIWNYVYAEASIKMPPGNGLWANFWTDRPKAWPPEIDIAEYIGSIPNAINLTSHYSTPTSAHEYVYHRHPTGANLSSGFHTYGLEWTTQELTFFVDGKRVKSFTGAAVPKDAMSFILRAGTGSLQWGGAIQNTRFPSVMYTDYVRVWKKGSSSTTTALPGTPPTISPGAPPAPIRTSPLATTNALSNLKVTLAESIHPNYVGKKASFSLTVTNAGKATFTGSLGVSVSVNGKYYGVAPLQSVTLPPGKTAKFKSGSTRGLPTIPFTLEAKVYNEKMKVGPTATFAIAD